MKNLKSSINNIEASLKNPKTVEAVYIDDFSVSLSKNDIERYSSLVNKLSTKKTINIIGFEKEKFLSPAVGFHEANLIGDRLLLVSAFDINNKNDKKLYAVFKYYFVSSNGNKYTVEDEAVRNELIKLKTNQDRTKIREQIFIYLLSKSDGLLSDIRMTEQGFDLWKKRLLRFLPDSTYQFGFFSPENKTVKFYKESKVFAKNLHKFVTNSESDDAANIRLAVRKR